jgi:hypothetical protein
MANILDNRWLGNISGATGAPVANDLATFNSTSIIYENTGKTFVRQALSGDVVALQNNNATTIQPNVVSDTKLRDSVALSVIGRSANTTGDPADIVGTASSDAVLRVSGTTLGFGQVQTAGIADSAVTLVKIGDLAQSRMIGRAEGAGTGVTQALTPTQIVAIIDGEIATWSIGPQNFLGGIYNSGVWHLDGFINVTVTTSQNDWAPTGFSTCNVVRANVNGVPQITGLTAGTSGRVVHIIRVDTDTDNLFSLVHESASSSAANRFILPSSSELFLSVGGSVTLWYDSTSSRWRVLSLKA